MKALVITRKREGFHENSDGRIAEAD